MAWTSTLQGALADLSRENEECLLSLMNDPQFAAFIRGALAKLTAGQREAAVSAAKAALGVLPPGLRHPVVAFSEKIAMP